MSNPICPGCNKEMTKSDLVDYECLDGCGNWYCDDPDKEEEAK